MTTLTKIGKKPLALPPYRHEAETRSAPHDKDGMDRDLVVRATNGDQRALESLLVMSHPRLYRVAYGILRDRHLAEDATQRAILDIWRDIRRLRDPGKFEGWSNRLLVRICYDEAKQQRAWVPDLASQVFASLRAPDPYGAVLDRDQLDRGFRHLSVEHRAVLVLRCMLDMPDGTSGRDARHRAGHGGLPTEPGRQRPACRPGGRLTDAAVRAGPAGGGPMNDDQLLREVGSWLLDADPAPPDARESVRQAMARTPQVRQRGRWWPLPILGRTAGPPTLDRTTDYQPTPIPATNGQTPTVIGRTQTMFSPAKAITAAALVFGIGSVMLIAQPFDQQGGSVPGAATDTGPVDPVWVTGTESLGPDCKDLGDPPPPPTTMSSRVRAVGTANRPGRPATHGSRAM